MQVETNLLTLDKSPERIAGMFDSVASHYDLMNDLMTGFSHRNTRKFALKLTGFKENMRALDLATGTGDFAFLLYEKARGRASVIGIDISGKMLEVARMRASLKGIQNIKFLQENIYSLPFEDNYFDVCTIGYGIRNVPDPVKAMREVFRVMRPGARFLIVEATPPVNRYLRFLSNFYFQKLVPLVAKFLSPNSDAYKYFAESVNAFPTAPRFAQMMKQVGWSTVKYFPMYFGTVTVFLGIK